MEHCIVENKLQVTVLMVRYASYDSFFGLFYKWSEREIPIVFCISAQKDGSI